MSSLRAGTQAPSAYLRTKGEAEVTVRESGLGWTLFRPSVIFGHDDDLLGPAGTDEWMAFFRDSENKIVGLVEHRRRS